MNRGAFIALALLDFGLVLASFAVLGVGGALVGPDRAFAVAAPLGIGAMLLAIVLFFRALGHLSGRWPMSER